jgi:hypothetical protein
MYWIIAIAALSLGSIYGFHKRSKQAYRPSDMADHLERLLDGTSRGWDVDNYEHLNPADPKLNDLWPQMTKAARACGR